MIPLLAAVALLAVVPAGRAAAAEPSGAVQGTVYDRDFDVPLAGARVAIEGAGLSTLTREDGSYVIEHVPAGSHTLTFSKTGYEREVRTVVVVDGQLAEANAELAAEVFDMEEMVVTGTDLLANTEFGQLEIRAEAVTIQDALSTEMINKAGVSDVAGALKLVVGASVSEGKYATVRGMSDRYTVTTVNGVRVPSTDPRRRAVQLDLFPTGTIDGLAVTKTFTPDQQGDSTGGSVDILTKSVPDGPLFAISTTLERGEATNNPDHLTYVGGGTGKWGFRADDEDKQLPAIASGNLNYATNPNYFATPKQISDAQALDQITRSFTPVMGTSRDEPGLNHGFKIVGGDRFSVGRGTLGFIGALSYSHKFDLYEDGQNNQVRVGEQGPVSILRSDNIGTDELLIGAVAGLNWSWRDGQEIGLALLGNEAAEDSARLLLAPSGGGVRENQSLHYTERLVSSVQLHGSHQLGRNGPLRAGPWQLSWLVSTNSTSQNEPDVRFFVNDHVLNTGSGSYTSEQPNSIPFADNTRRIFRDINEGSDQAGLNVELPFKSWTHGVGTIKAGLFVERGDREFTQKSFSYFFTKTPGSGAAANLNNSYQRYTSPDPDMLWTDVFLEPNRIGQPDNLCPVGRPSNLCAPPNQLLWYIDDFTDDVNYTAEQRINAAYAMAEVPLVPTLDLIAGARRETTYIHVVPVNLISGMIYVVKSTGGGNHTVEAIPQEDAIATIDEAALLPAAALVWTPQPRMNVRLSWSETIARPQYRELAPAQTQEYLAGDNFVGNPTLTLSDITNWDARWEWFRKPGEVLAASVFYKTIRDPIELISFYANGRDMIQPINYETGSLRGAEVEARADLGNFGRWARGLFVGVNATWLDSEVDVPPAEQAALAGSGLNEATRALQGQPAYLLNAFLTYDNDRTGTSAGLFYNETGDTLLTGAAFGIDNSTPNVFERAFGVLDFSVSQTIRKNLQVGFRARNLTQSDRGSVYRVPDGDESIKIDRASYRLFSVSLGLTW